MGGANLRSKAAVCPRQRQRQVARQHVAPDGGHRGTGLRAISDLRPNPVGCTTESEVSREGYLIICAHESEQFLSLNFNDVM